MKLGIGSYAYAWAIGVPGHPPRQPMDAFGFLRRSAERGVRLVQFADNLPLSDLEPDQLDWLEQEAETLGFQIEIGTRGIEPELLDNYRNLAQRFQSPIVRTVIDTADSQPSLKEVVSRLRWVMPRFERDGITLAIENHDRFTCDEFVEILERVASPRLRVCLDTANSFGALEGPEKVLDILGPWVVNLHVKDFEIRRLSHNMGFMIEGRPAGQGRLNIPRMLDQLRGHGHEPSVILELWPPLREDLEETIQVEDAWVEASIFYLRQLLRD